MNPYVYIYIYINIIYILNQIQLVKSCYILLYHTIHILVLSHTNPTSPIVPRYHVPWPRVALRHRNMTALEVATVLLLLFPSYRGSLDFIRATVDGCEILHQFMKKNIIYRVSTILLVVQDFATIHRTPSFLILPPLSSSEQRAPDLSGHCRTSTASSRKNVR